MPKKRALTFSVVEGIVEFFLKTTTNVSKNIRTALTGQEISTWIADVSYWSG